MNGSPTEPRHCPVCGAPLLPEHRFCANCGTYVASQQTDTSPESTGQPVESAQTAAPDPSTLETSEFEAQHRSPPQSGQSAESQPPASPYDTVYQDAGHPTWGTPETTVPPERGNRTLWIIIGIVAFIVLICCCILPLGLMAVANFDTAFQDDLRSYVALLAS